MAERISRVARLDANQVLTGDTFMKTTTVLAIALGLASLTACHKNDAADQKADNIEANAENVADNIEANADNMADNLQANAENKADAVRNAADNKADAVRNAADNSTGNETPKPTGNKTA